MNGVTVTTSTGTNEALVRAISFQTDHSDYSWLLLGLLATAMIVGGLRNFFRDQNSN
jgi:hypothetical protein